MGATLDISAYSAGTDGKLRTNDPDGNFGGAGLYYVSGTVSDGETLVVNGDSFGSGCANIVFENYENGIVGSNITTSDTNFNDAGSIVGIRSSDSRSGSKSASVFQTNGGNWAAAILGVVHDPVTEVFVSGAVKIPSGQRFPGNDGGTSGTNADYSTDSSWKPLWIFDDDTSDNDLVTPSHVGGGVWHHAGNDLGILKNWGTDPTWWEWTVWNRFATWLKAGTTPNVDAGDMYFQVANTVDPLFEDASNPVIFASGTSPYQFSQLNFPGWIRETATQNDVVVLQDDFYYAWGDNSAARIELGNASTYASCTDLAICDYTAWDGESVVVTCREGGLNLSQNTWLYITLSDNTTRYSIQVVSV